MNKELSKKTKILRNTIFTVAVFGLGVFLNAGQAQAAIECNDGIDNDGDGKIDYSATPGAGDIKCQSATDDHESDVPVGFFKMHSVFRQKVSNPAPVNTARTDAMKTAMSSEPQSMYMDYRNYPTYWVNETSVNQTVNCIPGFTCSNASYWNTYGWNIVPLNATNISNDNDFRCANPYGPYRDNEMTIRSADNTQEWTLTRFAMCNGSPGFYQPNAVARMNRNVENGVDSHNSVDGFMGCTFDANWHGTQDGKGNPSSGGWNRLVGALTYDEIANNKIQHIISFSQYDWRKTGGCYQPPYPACGSCTYGGSQGKDGYFMPGERVFLDRTYAQIDAIVASMGMSESHRRILYAIKDYGMIMTEATQYQHGFQVHTIADHTPAEWAALFGGNTTFAGFSSLIFPYIKVINTSPPPFIDQGECADGVDNDIPPDGKIDYPVDPGCDSAYGDDDESENPADVNEDGKVNIKDIQICIKAIIAPQSVPEYLEKCQAVALPDTMVNIKDIQEIIKAIIGG